MGRADYFSPGNWNVVCGECGEKWKATQLKMRWDGIWACRFCWEPRNAQDFLRGLRDDQAPPWTNPAPPPIFVGNTVGVENSSLRLMDGNVINGNTMG